MKTIEYPLSIHILYHQKYKEGDRLYKDLYKLLCRDSDAPFGTGLDIPIFFHTAIEERTPIFIENDKSDKKIILLLIDQYMYLSTEWKHYVDNLVSHIEPTGQYKENKNISIYPISLYKYAFDFSSSLAQKQFISFNNESLYDHWNEFQLRLYDIIIRFIQRADLKQKQTTIFISHSKQDANKHGERLAKSLRDYLLQGGTKLSSFFDVNSIMEGANFQNQIFGSVDSSIMIVIFSEMYSSREWCIKEILEAKKKKIPIIIVFDIQNEIDRIFPYIGNIPGTIYKDDWTPIINLLLRTTLRQFYQEQLLEKIANKDSILPYAPDAYSLNFYQESPKDPIIYPEPPLGKEEIGILTKLNDTIKFMTPMQYSIDTYDLKERSIAISISESEDQMNLGIGQEMIYDITLELLRYILIAGGKIVYGGNLQENNLTERFRELSYQYGQYKNGTSIRSKNPEDERYLTSFIAWPYHLIFNSDLLCEFQHSRVDLHFCDPDDNVPECERRIGLMGNDAEKEIKQIKALTKMRQEMENAVFEDRNGNKQELLARIFIGGKTKSPNGGKPGILEEFEIALSHKRPIFLIGGFGGETKRIIEHIKGNESQRIQGLNTYTLDDLHCGITDQKELDILFYSTNIFNVIPIILKGLYKLVTSK